MRVLLVAVSALALVLASCASSAPQEATEYDARLWPERPVVSLAVQVAPDLRTVRGRESVTFTPDLPTCELVFRAWPNNPTMSRGGSSLVVTAATVDGHPVPPRVDAAGAPPGAPGTVVVLPSRCLRPGEAVRADLDFTLTLGVGADERVGTDPATGTAWFGSGFPLLSWVRGRGWTRDPAVPMNGETATSEDFALTSLTVTAAGDQRVVGTGAAAGSAPGPGPGTTTHRFTAPAVRDVAVAVGRYAVRERQVEGVRLHLATPIAGTATDPDRWIAETGRAIAALRPVLGPFPYPDLWVAVTPGQTDGSEFPTALQLGDVDPDDVPALVTHEVGHQWFYALVGDNQARDPWLDESFAAFAETVAGVSSYDLDDIPDPARGRMGAPMAYWAEHGGLEAYTDGVYGQGAAVLAEARRRAGPARFDAALRAYIRTNAHRVAAPDDLSRAVADLPEVHDLLTQAGALPRR